MLHVFKWSHNAHTMLFFGHFTVYAYRTSEIFLQTIHLKFYFKKRNYFRDGITRLVINTRLFTTLKSVPMLKIIEFFFIYAFCTLWLNALWKVSLCILWKMVLFVHDFQTWRQIQNISKCKYFLLFYHNNLILKTDIMLDYW